MDELAGRTQGRKILLTVFILAFSALMFELLISRLSPFYLNYMNAFLAIPLTLFGLAVGSLWAHLRKRSFEKLDISRDLIMLTIVSYFSFAVVFFVFSQFFPVSYRGDTMNLLMAAKTVVFVALFLPPFFYIGKILTLLYANYRTMIGKLYAMDFIGGSLACFATPVLFHFIDFPYLVFICLIALTTVTALSLHGKRILSLLIFVVSIAGLLPLLVYLEGHYDMRHSVRMADVKEIAHRWNELSRVSLVRMGNAAGQLVGYRIIHDNAESNVNIGPYVPGRKISFEPTDLGAPFLLKRSTDNMLAMFAGCGIQMIRFNELGGGKNLIAGVEINPLVIDFAVKAKELAPYRLGEFYALTNVEMNVAEGRYFLDHDSRKYDVIFVGSNAATNKYKTGHSRKYLDTKEAVDVYYDHLKPNGMLIVHNQPAYNKITGLHQLFKERKLGDLGSHIFLMSKSLNNLDCMVFSKSRFTNKEAQILTTFYGNLKEMIRFAPGYKRNYPPIARMIREGAGQGEERLVTDDRPFLIPLDFKAYKLFPIINYSNWIRITTLLFVTVLVFGLLVALYIARAKMPPPNMVIYLVFTGICYMIVQISYISKLDLFLGNPLYSMALLISVFLITNALGSMAYSRFGNRLKMTWMPIVVGGIVVLSLLVINSVTKSQLGLPLPLKILISSAIISPVGICLGLFYPYVVTWLTERNLVQAVPVTYAVSTLASVWGATYAMTLMINIGYTHLIYQAAIGYGALTVLMLIYNLIFKSSR